MEDILQAVGALEAYDEAISQVLPATTSNSMAYKVASELLSGAAAPGSADSTLYKAYASLMRLTDLIRGH